MLNLHVNFSGDKELIAALRRVSKNMTNFQDELNTMGDFMQNFYRTRLFATDGAILGERWLNLKPSYEFAKRKKWGGKGILERTGTLKRSYDYSAEPMVLTVANVTDYAKYHHLGGSRIPKRTLIGFNDDIGKKLVNVMTKAVLVKLNK